MKFLNLLLLGALALGTTQAGAQSEPIAYWSFNDTSLKGGGFGFLPAQFPMPADDGALAADAILSLGTLTATVGGNGALNCVEAFAGSTVNALPTVVAGGSLSPVGCTAGLTNNNTYFEFVVSTVGFQNIQVSWAQRGTATGFNSRQFAYSIDGGDTFVDFDSDTGALTSTFVIREYDLQAIAAINDNPDVMFRVTISGATSASGNNRYDNILVEGEPSGPVGLAIPYFNDFSTDPFLEDWSDQNVVGAQTWSWSESFQNVSFQPFASGCQVNENWLVSPLFNLAAQEDELLLVDVAKNFDGPNNLQILYSTDYPGTGDPNQFTWTLIRSIATSELATNNVPETFGPFTDLQSIAGNARIALRADHVSGTACATWRVANFDIVLEIPKPPKPEVVEIFEIQGEGLRSPYAPPSGNTAGETVRTENNIVTAVTNLAINNGFFIQMPDDRDSSAQPQASRGIFVFTGTVATVAVGDLVSVTGSVAEFFEFTQLTNVSNLEVVSSANPMPTAVSFDAVTPSPDPTTPSCGVNNFECFEGMLISVADGYVTAPNQTFVSDPIAEPVVTANGMRALRGPGAEFPGLGSACPTCPVWSGAPEVFEIDLDRLGGSNPTVAAGSRFTATGVLGYEFSDYELWPVEYTLIDEPTLPAPVTGAAPHVVSIASYNVLDLFDTVQQNDPPRPIPACGAGYVAEDRVVNSEADYDVKLTKLANSIIQNMLLPDVIALQEVESVATLDDLSARIATLSADAVLYDSYLIQGNDRGEINNGFLVNPARVSVDSVQQLAGDECLSSDNTPLHDRPPLLLRARFVHEGANWPFLVMNNHLRSLGSIETSARTRLKRHEQAQSIAALVQAIQTEHLGRGEKPIDPALRLVLVGDKNAFQFPDGYVDVVGLIRGVANPDDSLVNIENEATPGFTSANITNPPLTAGVLQIPEDERYSFIFRGISQVLDHALLTLAAQAHFEDIQYVRGNADYWRGFGSDPSSLAFAADHDALVVYLNTDVVFRGDFEQVPSLD